MTHSGQGPEQQYPAAQPLPPEATPGGPSDAQATQYLPPIPAQPAAPPPGYGYPQAASPQPGYGYPGPDAQATQYLPPVAPQSAPPVPPAADAQATQYLPPVAGPVPGQAPGGPDAQATQYLAPVPPQAPQPPVAPQPPHVQQERPPLADFDNLFRSETPQQAPGPVPQPQHPQPQYQQHQPPQPQYQQQHHQPQHHQPPQPPQQQYGGFQEAYYDDEPEPPRRKSPAVLIAAVVAACAVVGLGAGALLSGGDDDKKDTAGDKGGQNVAASSAAPSAGASEKPADPALAQAQALDKLLADSNNSRDAVIRSVESIKNCSNLDQAASDLRGAAEQRRGLVTRLQALTVDQIPNSSALTGALTRAWQASASADDHYAAWADQMKGKKACKGGKARGTGQTVEANKKSGEATTAKQEAAGLWNPTAEKYGLTKRDKSQL
ncbi:hypothetical protein ACIGO8_17070 [Streptomyces sp. NPDC053493]|uniref:hypothetical protein n=1 Tax=Streptomyces sp. NPDC053493 TaxID=3365705 RepID=UPI0037D53CFF